MIHSYQIHIIFQKIIYKNKDEKVYINYILKKID